MLTACDRVAQPRVVSKGTLWLPPGATSDQGARFYVDGSGDLPFVVPDAEPVKTSDQFVAHYRGLGWIRRSVDRNGHNLAVHWTTTSGGGIVSLDADGQPSRNVDWEWSAAWESSTGEIVTCRMKISVAPNALRGDILGYAVNASARTSSQ
jgi:hypothetical protein